VFRKVTLRGQAGAITWGYHTAAALRAWIVTKDDKGAWRLEAGVDRADRLQLRQAPLLFTAPRIGRIGRACWPIRTVTLEAERLTAELGPPER
jgi:hypothetical protein